MWPATSFSFKKWRPDDFPLLLCFDLKIIRFLVQPRLCGLAATDRNGLNEDCLSLETVDGIDDVE